LILPFEITYLHQIRGFATATAGLVLAAILGTATLVTPASGALLDHFRPKPILIAGNHTSALGYAGFAFIDRPWQAFARTVVSGAAVGAARTANQTLLITLATRGGKTRAPARKVQKNNQSSPTARVVTGPGPYALLTLVALMGADESEVSCARFGHRAQPAITEETSRWTVS
jgi:MFS family permease